MASTASQPPVFPIVTTATNSEVDSFAAAKIPTHAFFLSGIAPDLCYEAPPLFIERSDGTANLEGVVRSTSNPKLRFLARVDLSGRSVFGDPSFPPLGSPKLELLPSAYVSASGPIDPTTFYYYTTFTGSLFGLDDMFGCHVALSKFGPCFQVGVGANGMNAHDGMSSWFTAKTTSQAIAGQALPVQFEGDINVDRDVTPPLCTRAAFGDSFGQFVSGFAIWLPGIENFTLEPGATFVESPNGTAKLIGVGDGISDPNAKVAVNVDFSLRIDPIDAGYPPAGSPKLELLPSSYVSNGGPVDPSKWHYYQAFHGTLIGMGSIAGAVIDVSRTGPSFQVGIGANGKNIGWGGSAWMTSVVLSLPTVGAQWPTILMGDLNVDLRTDCVEPTHVNSMAVTSYGAGCSGLGALVPSLSTLGSLAGGTTGTLVVSNAGANTLLILLVGTNPAQLAVGLGCNLLVASPVIAGNPVFTDVFGSYSTTFDIPIALVAESWRMQAALAPMQGNFTMTNGLLVAVQ